MSTSWTTLDLSPAAGPAPTGRRVLRHVVTEAKLLARNGEQLLLALVIPAGLLLLAPVVHGRFGLDLAGLQPSVLALAVWSSAFTSTAIATGFERRYGVLERLATTPLGRPGLIMGKVGSVLLVIIAQIAVLTAIGLATGWRPRITALSTVVVLGCTVLAITTFVALALALAGTLRAEATLGLANLIYLVMAVAGGLMVPLAAYPTGLRSVVTMLPTAAWGEAVRSWSAGLVIWWPVVVLAGWAAGSVLLASKVFRWMS